METLESHTICQGSELEKLRKERDALEAEKVRCRKSARTTTLTPAAEQELIRSVHPGFRTRYVYPRTLPSSERWQGGCSAHTRRSASDSAGISAVRHSFHLYLHVGPIHCLSFTSLTSSPRTRKIIKDMVAEGIVRDYEELRAFVGRPLTFCTRGSRKLTVFSIGGSDTRLQHHSSTFLHHRARLFCRGCSPARTE